MEYNKISDSELEVIKPEVTAEVKTTYSLDFLKSQELAILKSMNDFVELRKKELIGVKMLIAEAEKLGLKTSADLAEEERLAKVAEESVRAESLSEVIE